MMARLRKAWHRRQARRIIRGLDPAYRSAARVIDYPRDPLVDAFRDAKARGVIGDLSFREFYQSRRHPWGWLKSWPDRRLEARLTKLGL